MAQGPSFFLVVPAYRESRRLPNFLPHLAETLIERFPSARIQVVDDGSGPEEQAETSRQLGSLQKNFFNLLEPLLLPHNLGKGGAILAAWDKNPGLDYLAFVDADGAISPEEVCRLASLLPPSENQRTLFASRIRMLGRKVDRKYLRHYAGRFFATCIGGLLNAEVYDSQCGLKFLPATAYSQIRPWLEGRRFAFDLELLATLRHIGCPIEEVPIHWHDVAGSKVSLGRDSLRMLCSAWSIRHARQTWPSPKS
jgi:dolichyl-phosphate beta-glucosyltransferase